MNVSKATKRETLHIALGVLAGDGMMFIVFAVLHSLDLSVFLGAAFGSFFAVLNFFLLGVGLQKALQEPETAKARVQRYYGLRMLMLVAVMALGVALPCFNSIAVVVPFLLPNLTIQVMRLLGIYKSEPKGGEKT